MSTQPFVFDMSIQEAFDRMVRGLAAQGWRRSRTTEDGTACLYRGPEGWKCAVGQLIDDETARAWDSRAGNFSSGISKVFAAGLCDFPDPSLLAFISTAQDKHDLHKYPLDMRAAFLDLGVRHALTWPADVHSDGPIDGGGTPE